MKPIHHTMIGRQTNNQTYGDALHAMLQVFGDPNHGCDDEWTDPRHR